MIREKQRQYQTRQDRASATPRLTRCLSEDMSAQLGRSQQTRREYGGKRPPNSLDFIPRQDIETFLTSLD
jgi:hypothetical protein